MKARVPPTSCGKSPKCGANADERHLHSLVAGTEALCSLARTDCGLAGPTIAVSPGTRLRPGASLPKSRNGSYLQFVAPGVISMTILFSAIFSGIAMLWDR